jgi:hypothetical protein
MWPFVQDAELLSSGLLATMAVAPATSLPLCLAAKKQHHLLNNVPTRFYNLTP